MNGNLDLDTLGKMVRAGDIDTVVVAFPDMQGRLMGKRMTGHYFLDAVAEAETHACNYLLTVDMDMEPVPGYAAAAWEKGYGDYAMRPDLSTLRRIPWLEGTALVLADLVEHDGAEVPHAPRSMLKAQVARLEERGWKAYMASELEIYVFNETYESARAKGYRNLDASGWYIEDYHIFQTSKEEELVRAIRNSMDAIGIPVECSKGEYGPGQEEINVEYAEALEMADRHVIYKNGAKEIAHQHGKCITFMAKPDYVNAGSSCHIHSSLWREDGAHPLFPEADDPHGMSKLFKHYLAGQLALARPMTYFLAPYINSYKRFQAASFAPTKAMWCLDNRTAGYRLVGHGRSIRIECRVAGGDVNPYLAYAAIIAAGLHGIDNELELEPMCEGNLYAMEGVREIPKTLREALGELDSCQPFREAFSDAVIEHYLHTGRWEQFEYDRRVTDWELQRLFERA